MKIAIWPRTALNNTWLTDFLQEIFRLFISIFADLTETSSPYLTRRMKILESVAALRCSMIMLNIGCEDLILDMVKIFFTSVRYKDIYCFCCYPLKLCSNHHSNMMHLSIICLQMQLFLVEHILVVIVRCVFFSTYISLLSVHLAFYGDI